MPRIWWWWGVSAEARALPVGATNAITNLMVNFFIGMSVGVGVTVAHGLGSRESDSVRNAVHTAVPVAVCAGLILSAVGITFCATFLRYMGTPEPVLPLSVAYMRICFSGAAFNILYNYCAAILRAAGDTRSPLIYLTISGVVPVVGSILSDASEAVLVGAGTVKNAAGIYGLLAVLAVWLGPFVKIGTHYLMLKLTAGLCGIFGNKRMSELVNDFSTAMGFVVAMTGAVCLMLMISTVCFMKGVS